MVQVSSYFISLVVILIVQLEFVNSFVSYNKFHFTIDREHVFYSTENTDNPGTPNSGTNSNSISNSNSNSNSPHIRSDIVNFDVNKLKQWRMAEMYPTRVSKQNMEKDSRGYPNYAELPPDDPLFLDMPWPEETGPESSAFARHFQWKRKLSDGERIRWQKWAVYQRTMKDNMYEYSLADYMFQNTQREADLKALKLLEAGKDVEAIMLSSFANGLRQIENDEVLNTVKAYYSALNRRNFDDLRLFWLPDSNAELAIPGIKRTRGYLAIDKRYRSFAKELKYLGKVDTQIYSVKSFGFVAVVKTLETISPGSDLQILKKKGDATSENLPTMKQVLVTTVLRKWNKQWRILSHHGVAVDEDPFLSNRKAVAPGSRVNYGFHTKVNKMTSNLKSDVTVKKSDTIPFVETIKSLVGGSDSASSFSFRRRSDGGWERVVSYDKDSKKPVKGGNSDIAVERSRVLENLERGVVEAKPKPQSVTRMTLNALRYLQRIGRINKIDKEILISEMINSVAEDSNSAVTTAYELLCTSHPNTIERSVTSYVTNAAENGEVPKNIDDFADQCDFIIGKLKAGFD